MSDDLGAQLYQEQRQIAAALFQLLEERKRSLTPPELVDEGEHNLVLKGMVVIASWEDLETGAQWMSQLDAEGMSGDRHLAPWTYRGLVEQALLGVPGAH